MTIRVLLVDDQTLIRQGIRLLLEIEPDIQVVGQASDGLEALQKVDALHPDRPEGHSNPTGPTGSTR